MRIFPWLALLLSSGCLLDPEEHAERLLCRELRDALDDDSPAPSGAGGPPDIEAGPVVFEGLDNFIDYTPDPAGTKMFASTTRMRLQVIDEFGRDPDRGPQEEPLCDGLAMRWTFDLEPRPYYLLIDEVEDTPYAMMAVTIEEP